MADDNDSGGCSIWVFIILIALAIMCDRLDNLEKKIDAIIESPIENIK
jgi:hypothetical protein